MNQLLSEELQELRQNNLYRSLRTLEPVSNVRARFQGRDILLFCGNDYLGLAHDPRVIEAAQKALNTAGVGAGAARLISGTTQFHAELESKIAQLRGKERALVFSAGYLTNLGVLSSLADKRDVIVMDKLCHASLIDGARLSGAKVRVFPHKNYDKCDAILSHEKGYRRCLIISDTVFSMDGDVADLPMLIKIKKKYGAFLIVDDAHGLGVLGSCGQGVPEEKALAEDIDVITGTLSKTAACLGGYAAASETVIDYLINHARPFIFATALSPVLCAAALEALTIMTQDSSLRHKLWENIRFLQEHLIDSGLNIPKPQSAILPLLIGDEKKALNISTALLDEGLLVPAVRYPTVAKHKARLRITVSAGHERADLEKLVKQLEGLAIIA